MEFFDLNTEIEWNGMKPVHQTLRIDICRPQVLQEDGLCCRMDGHAAFNVFTIWLQYIASTSNQK